MSLTVQQAIDQVRSVHPAFSRYMVPDKALADFFTREQQRLMTLAVSRDRSYLSQSLSILFDLSNADADAPGTAGAGTAGGVPVVPAGSTYTPSQTTTGSAVGVSDGALLVNDTSVVSATATTLTGLGASWTTDAYAGKIVRIVAGKGANTSPRTIASNTATTLTVTQAWEVTPDATSTFHIAPAVTTADGTLGAVTDLPSVSTNRGFLVKLNAQGVAYLDYAAPLVGHVSRGIPLPSYHSVLGGTVRWSASAGATWATAQSDYGAMPLMLVSKSMRYSAPRRPAAYLDGQKLFLVGQRIEWQAAESIELFYTPVPPSFTARTDLFLLPDHALHVLVAKGAVFAASRITGVPNVPQPPSDLLVAEAAEAEAGFLATISLTKRSRIGRVRPGGY